MSINLFLFSMITGGLLFGKFAQYIKVPAILGMILFGLIINPILPGFEPDLYTKLEPSLKSFALIVILLRAGLGLNRKMLHKAGFTALFMGFVPCLVEIAAVTIGAHLLFNFSLSTALLTGALLSAVSPAVVVPSMLKLQEEGRGKAREVPTVILAGASVDDVLAITIFSVVLSRILTGEGSVLMLTAVIPLSLIGGAFLGLLGGFITLKILEKSNASLQKTEQTLILLAAAFLVNEIGNTLHAASLLAVMVASFVIFEKSPPLAKALSHQLSRFWIFAEILLFVSIGFAVNIPVALSSGFRGLILILFGLTARSLGVLLSTCKSDLTKRERLFCVFAYLPKATVQAALGGVALQMGLPEGDTILALALLAIIISVPLGIIGITVGGKRLLSIDISTEDEIF